MNIFGVFLLLIFAYGLVSRRLEQTIITGPMIFALAGSIMAFLQPQLFEAEISSEAILLLSELALVVVLFGDASHIQVGALISGASLPARLLVIGMPLTILLGAVIAAVLFGQLSIWEAAILATILAPTDVGLGQMVVNSPSVPIRIRRALNVEAGLNDGLSVPFLMLFIALAQTELLTQDSAWIPYTLRLIGLGGLTGLVLGLAGGWLIGRSHERNWMGHGSQQLVLLSIALMCWRAAEVIGGNGFIAAFVGGLVIRVGYEHAGERMVEFSEEWGDLLSFFIFFIFGVLAAGAFASLAPLIILYALFSLTLIRMLPAAIALLGTGLQRASVLFMGWFGPRGLASVVLGLVFLEREADLANESHILAVVTGTVFLSIFAHGISTMPGIKWYAKKVEQLAADAPELKEREEMPA